MVRMAQNVMQDFGGRDFILFDKNSLRDGFKRSLTYSCPKKIYESPIALRIHIHKRSIP